MAQSFAEALSWVPKSRHLATSLQRAHDYARAQGHPTVGLEHLLASLVDDPEAASVLQASRIPLPRLNGELNAYLSTLPPSDSSDPEADPALLRILEYAVAAAQQSRRREVSGAIVIAAIVGEGKSEAANMLRSLGLTFEEAIKALQRASAPQRPEPQPAPQMPPMEPMAPPPRHDESAFGIDEQQPDMEMPPAAVASRETEEILAGARRRVRASSRNQASAEPLTTLRDAAQARAAPVEPPPPPPPQRSSGAYDAFREDVPPQQPPPQPLQPPPESSWAPPPQQQHGTQAPSRPMRMPPPMPVPGAGGMQLPSAPGLPSGPPPQQSYGNGRMQPSMPPWSDSDAPQRPQPAADNARPSTNGRRQGRRGASARSASGIDPEQLIENIPRSMRLGTADVVEVRIPKSAIASIAGVDVREAQRRPAPSTRAMTVRLRAPDGGFSIAASTPETQWVDGQMPQLSDDVAAWRWSVTPTARGVGRLQLVLSMRVVSEDGLAPETALPDQFVDIRVSRNWGRAFRRFLGFLFACGIGAMAARYGETAINAAIVALRQASGGG